jgi:hypothetical protein
MIAKDLHAYRVRNLRQEKSLRDQGREGAPITGGIAHDGLIVMLPRSELAVIECDDAAVLGTVTVLVPT